jgi:DNA-binding NarL/FixJ family response regulator
MVMSANHKFSILIADDKQIILLGLRELLRQLSDCTVISEARNGTAALTITLAHEPDIVFLKYDLPELDGVKVCQRIKRKLPRTKVVLLLAAVNDFWSALESGADAYLLREQLSDIVPALVQCLTTGGAFIGPTLAAYLLKGDGLARLRAAADSPKNAIFSSDNLTNREKDVLNLLVEGLSNQKIAEKLSLSPQTVKVHVRHILKKLAVTDRTQAVLKVLRPMEMAGNQ